jgi:non-ribosomal peptide synthetase-like protein
MRAGRIAWTVVTIIVVQGFVCGAALVPVLFLWSQIAVVTESSGALRLIVFSVAAVPAYALFAMLLMLTSAVTTRAVGWRTPPDLEAPIAGVDWPLVQWVRCMVATHIVRLFAGAMFRGSPIWTAYLRLAGARIGRRVYVNSLSVSDYNLLEFGDDVVIGEHVHLSGHTVEGGVLRTARVRLGHHVTIGVASIVDIGVEIGEGCQVGACSLVPKHTRLEAGAVYAGIPVRRIDRQMPSQPPRTISHRT